MKILFFGDSITDANRERETDFGLKSYGFGYVRAIAGNLLLDNPNKYEIINRGIGGNRIVDLYARIKKDLWNEEPDFLNILIGVNDVWHEIAHQNGVDLVRFEKVYRTIIEETKERLPKIKIILCEPFVLLGGATEGAYDRFLEVREYAKIVKKIAKEYGLYFLPLQEKFDKLAEKDGAINYLFDGVHPSVAGAQLIANEWLALFNDILLNSKNEK
jgi:lysophospholipase L1-like esterase